MALDIAINFQQFIKKIAEFSKVTRNSNNAIIMEKYIEAFQKDHYQVELILYYQVL